MFFFFYFMRQKRERDRPNKMFISFYFLSPTNVYFHKQEERKINNEKNRGFKSYIINAKLKQILSHTKFYPFELPKNLFVQFVKMSFLYCSCVAKYLIFLEFLHRNETLFRPTVPNMVIILSSTPFCCLLPSCNIISLCVIHHVDNVER